MFRNILIPTVSTLALAAVLSTQAQPFSGPRGPMEFSDMDLDSNGYVSPDEFARHRAARMSERAAQGRLLRNAAQAPSFEGWDTDSDGQLSRTEVTNGQQARFDERVAAGRPCRRNP
ncbi:MAG: EF-hand domain-containing protein [Chromatiaceae bacterium]|jgi:hypothetical protein|nr:EF-hand domain-containing protein [Chromatiaceae bacterium]